MSDRCIQCGWTISPRRLDDVRRDSMVIPLHKGGCPRPPAIKPAAPRIGG